MARAGKLLKKFKYIVFFKHDIENKCHDLLFGLNVTMYFPNRIKLTQWKIFSGIKYIYNFTLVIV